MAEQQDPLGCITAAEAGMFRAGQLARRLLADHPELTPRKALSVFVDTFATYDPADPVSCRFRLDIDAGSVEAARQWAQALGIELEQRLVSGLEMLRGSRDIDGVTVQLGGFRPLTQEERQAAEAEQPGPGESCQPAAAGGEGRG